MDKREMNYSTEEIIKRLRLMDDDFMTAVFDNNIEDTQLVLRILIGRDDLEVTKVTSQKEIKNLKGRSVRLDIYAKDSDGKIYDIEIQRADAGAMPGRARFNSSLIDSDEVKAGATYDKLPETYVIFITEKDFFKDNLSIYHIERVIMETGKLFSDKEHIIYVNGATMEDSDIGKLMHDFRESDPDNMYFKELADTTRYYKEEGGKPKMCKLIEEMRLEERSEGASLMLSLYKALKSIGRLDDYDRASEDQSYCDELLKEFGLA